MKKYCSKCGREIPEGIKTFLYVCPFCGCTSVTTTPPHTSKSSMPPLPSPLWIYLLLLVCIIFFFFLGWLTDNPMGYIAGVVLIIAMVNDIKKLGLERGGPRWETLGRFLYLGVSAVFTVYLTFKNVLYGYLSLGVFLATAGFVLFTRNGKVIKKYTVFQEKYLPLVVIISSILIIIVKILFF